MENSRAKQREINSLANNTPNLKDWAKKGLQENGDVKQGYFRLYDNRVIKIADLYRTTRKINAVIDDVERQAAEHPELYNCKGIGIDKETGKVKPGFYELMDGKVISLNKLAEAIELREFSAQQKQEDINNIDVTTE